MKVCVLLLTHYLYTGYELLYVLCFESFPFIGKRLNKCLGANLRSVTMKAGTVTQCSDQTGDVSYVDQQGFHPIQLPLYEEVLLGMADCCHEGRHSEHWQICRFIRQCQKWVFLFRSSWFLNADSSVSFEVLKPNSNVSAG